MGPQKVAKTKEREKKLKENLSNVCLLGYCMLEMYSGKAELATQSLLSLLHRR